MGQHYDEFWRRTPAEFNLIVSARIDAEKDAARGRRALAYAIGELVAVAFNNPKKFPKAADYLQERQRRVVTSLEERREVLGRFARKMKNGS